jgi:beta-glucosidase-like glycosyl hydrolase/CubicO group peptidase (beta-lactamase class C family)
MRIRKSKIKISLIIAFLVANVFHVEAQLYKNMDEPAMNQWVDSVYNSLSVEERIGQLIFVRANQSGKEYENKVDDLIRDFNVGGIVFFKSDAVSQALKTNYWNSMAKTPLMIAIDAEWGLGMRLTNTIKYPLQMTLGAISNDSSLYEMGMQIGWQCKRMGIHMNYAPDVDVNSNALNPVIGMRSFGENPQQVAHKGYFYMKGMQDAGIIACAKHFPGHGDTQTDSHFTLPVVKGKKKDLRKTEFVPFQYLIDGGVAAVMTAHLSVPALEKNKNKPSSLSYKIVTKLLKEKMAFDGLVVTDGLDMKGVTINHKKGEVAREAFLAGNDILIIPADVRASVDLIKEAIAKKKSSMLRLEESCKKILIYKYLSGAWKREMVDTTNLVEDLNNEEFSKLSKNLAYDAITIVKNKNNILPLSHPDTLKPAVIVIGYDQTDFEKVLLDFMPAKVFYLSHKADIAAKQKIINELDDVNLVIFAITNTNISAGRRFGISESDVQFVSRIAMKYNSILDVFASPYSLNFFPNLYDFEAVVVSYQDKSYLMKRSAEIMLGMAAAKGELPVSAGGFPVSTGLKTQKTRLTYSSPKELNIDESILWKIDSIALNGIEIGAFPGCQILAAKDGFIFYDKTFGFHTYENKTEVKKNDIYDLASLTKILATTPSLMKSYDEKKIDIDKPLSDYLLYLKDSNKKDMIIKDILAHQAGLFSWIPYFENTIIKDIWDTAYYHSAISEEYPVRVAEDMYIHENYNYEIYNEIAKSEVGEKKYQYSDLGFYLFRHLVEVCSNKAFDEYAYEAFYKPLGLNNMRFKPLRYFAKNRICPTEFDRIFRHQLLVGDVHDQGAAMMGGVSGHAGLFANSYDVAVMMQMMLNGGVYGGREFITKETLDIFISYHFIENENRRGLGFDKALLEYEDHRSNCKSASESSFGHSGFTGTYTWADPENGLVYVFLSNRVNPDMNNNKLGELDVRTNIHQLFYDAINVK